MKEKKKYINKIVKEKLGEAECYYFLDLVLLLYVNSTSNLGKLNKNFEKRSSRFLNIKVLKLFKGIFILFIKKQL